ncbi:MAG: ABC transporter permease [Armatimonadota bacterium]|nr:ABC transporter permease [bacterium]MCS7309765.1 ABC transporter permease [Armatimonadota bacterium]MDW8104025.1 ABC transporter permease [Armatimonadota bacterium]MDW8290066.1 ABC transporter permease [Armatimonadota bacterium]
MLNALRELYRYRELLWTLVLRELRVRYKNSYLGFFWSLIVPLVTVAVLTIVFKRVMGMAIPNYSAYVLAAFLPWMYFQTALLDSSQSVLAQIQLVKKVYFPREVLPLAAVLANLVHFLLALVVFFVYLLGYVGAPLLPSVALLPVLVFFQTLLIAGLSLFISCLNVFYEDTKYIVSIGLQLMFYLVPVIYFSEQVYHAQLVSPEWQRWVYVVYHLNPIAMLMTAYRKVLLPPITVQQVGAVQQQSFTALPMDWGLLATACMVSALTFAAGYAFFNKRKWDFAEQP